MPDRPVTGWRRDTLLLRSVGAGVLGAGKGLLDLVAPAACASCGKVPASPRGDGLCRTCEETFPAPASQSCAGCGGLPEEGPPDLCGRCRKRFFRDGLVALAPLEGRAREMVHALKYRGDLRAGRCLARKLGAKVAAELPGACDVIVPVPLHFRRLRSRGFNQAAVLARGVARITRWPVRPLALKRTSRTRPLTGLGAGERQREMRGTIAVRSASAIRGRRVLLVDDVVTSGTTSEECCCVLRRMGARRVYVAAVGRA